MKFILKKLGYYTTLFMSSNLRFTEMLACYWYFLILYNMGSDSSFDTKNTIIKVNYLNITYSHDLTKKRVLVLLGEYNFKKSVWNKFRPLVNFEAWTITVTCTNNTHCVFYNFTTVGTGRLLLAYSCWTDIK